VSPAVHGWAGHAARRLQSDTPDQIVTLVDKRLKKTAAVGEAVKESRSLSPWVAVYTLDTSVPNGFSRGLDVRRLTARGSVNEIGAQMRFIVC
jgi:hypothetical protein